jgi:hypothetical protein
MMYSGKGKLPKAKAFRSVLPGCMVNSHATVVPGAGRSAAVIQTVFLLLLARGMLCVLFLYGLNFPRRF